MEVACTFRRSREDRASLSISESRSNCCSPDIEKTNDKSCLVDRYLIVETSTTRVRVFKCPEVNRASCREFDAFLDSIMFRNERTQSAFKIANRLSKVLVRRREPRRTPASNRVVENHELFELCLSPTAADLKNVESPQTTEDIELRWMQN